MVLEVEKIVHFQGREGMSFFQFSLPGSHGLKKRSKTKMADFEKVKTLVYSLVNIVFFVNIVLNNVQVDAISNIPSCRKLGTSCLECELNEACEYGKDIKVECKAVESCPCEVSIHFVKFTTVFITTTFLSNWYILKNRYI